MMDAKSLRPEERQFRSRLLALADDGFGVAPTFDPARINQHLEGRSDGKRIMTDEEVERLLSDPFATLVLRRGRFPADLTELLAALDEHNDGALGLPDTSSFLISEGGQIPFSPGVDKGSSRLLTVRSRGTEAELMISSLTPAGVSPRSPRVLLEVIAWDPVNETFHFYQRQQGAWFWCGQSDMAFDADTRGHGPFDSHINGYPNMKELKTPWVHWHGPGLGIAETAYASDDPLANDPLFLGKDNALVFERRVIRPLSNRWNHARFRKAVGGAPQLGSARAYLRQLLDSTSFNLISTHTEFSQLFARDLDDLPATFFVDVDCLGDVVGLRAEVPRLRMSRDRYAALIEKYDLRVRGGGVDMPGDVPFCFTVPERAFEDVLSVQALITGGLLSRRLAACLLMIDFPNPLGSSRRASLLAHLPDSLQLRSDTDLDSIFVPALLAAAEGAPEPSVEREFETHWNLGPDAWRDVFADRVEAYLAAIAERLATDDGCDDIFRLAESRRRQIRPMPLLEFDLALPIALQIPGDAPPLAMTEQALVEQRS